LFVAVIVIAQHLSFDSTVFSITIDTTAPISP